MSRGLSRQQVGILLYMRQREEGCVRRYLDAPQTATCYNCGRPCPEDGPYGSCYRCQLRWCPKCTTSSMDIVVHFWPDPPQPKAEYLQKLKDDPKFRAWTEGFQRLVASMSRRRHVYVNDVRHTSVQRAMLGLEKRGLVAHLHREWRGYKWFTKWHPVYGGLIPSRVEYKCCVDV